MYKTAVASLSREDRPCRPWGTTRWCDTQPVKHTGARVECLIPSSEYVNVTVVAHNIVGRGEPSLPLPRFSTHAAASMGPVMYPRVSEISHNAFRLSWCACGRAVLAGREFISY